MVCGFSACRGETSSWKRYLITAGHRIILLTVFRKQRRHERAEIERAYKAMQRCIEEKHVAEENSDETA